MYLGSRMCDIDFPQDGIAIICEHNACSRDVSSVQAAQAANGKQLGR